MMIGGLGIIRGQGSGGSQTKVAPFWMDRYPSEIGDEMSVEDESIRRAVQAAIRDQVEVTARRVLSAGKAAGALTIISSNEMPRNDIVLMVHTDVHDRAKALVKEMGGRS